MIKIVKCIKAVPVTMADRGALESERDQHEQTIGHLNVRWTAVAAALNGCNKAALQARHDAGNQTLSAERDLEVAATRDDRLNVGRRLASAMDRRTRSDARRGKLGRWRTDIGGSVRARAGLYGKRVAEINKILVAGVQEVPVEIRIDTEDGTAEMTRLDTGHVVAIHRMTDAQRRKYAPPPPEPRTAADRTEPLPFPKTEEQLADETKPGEPEVIDEMPKADEDSEAKSDFEEFIHRGRSVEDRLVKEFGAAEARRIVEAIKAGEPGDVVIDEARARKAAAKKRDEPTANTVAPEPEPPMIGVSDKDMLLWDDEFGEDVAAEIAEQVASGFPKDLAVLQARKREKALGASKESARVSANDREHAAIVQRHTAELGAGLAERLAWAVRSGNLEDIALEHARASVDYAKANPDLVAELGDWWAKVETNLMTGFDFDQAISMAEDAKRKAETEAAAQTPAKKARQAKAAKELGAKLATEGPKSRAEEASAAFKAAAPPKQPRSKKKGGGK